MATDSQKSLDKETGMSARDRQIMEMVADMFGGSFGINTMQDAQQADMKMTERLKTSAEGTKSGRYYEGKQRMQQDQLQMMRQDQRMSQQHRQSEQRNTQQQLKAAMHGQASSMSRGKPDGLDAILARAAYEKTQSGQYEY